MQGDKMKDIAHDVVCQKKTYEVGGCKGDNANVGGGGYLYVESCYVLQIGPCKMKPRNANSTQKKTFMPY